MWKLFYNFYTELVLHEATLLHHYFVTSDRNSVQLLLRRSLVRPVILFRCENFPKIIHADHAEKNPRHLRANLRSSAGKLKRKNLFEFFDHFLRVG